MQERLQEILEKEHLTPARFAELIGVQRSSVSHILSGRNNPSLDFLQKILLHLEHINPDWLISGKGSYKRNHDQSANQIDTRQSTSTTTTNTGKIEFPEKSPVKDEDQPPYFRKKQENNNQTPQENREKQDRAQTTRNIPSDSPSDPGRDILSKEQAHAASHRKEIIKTVLFYDDQTFEVFYPSF